MQQMQDAQAPLFSKNFKRDAVGPVPAKQSADLSPWLGGRTFEQCRRECDERGYIVFESVMSPDEVARVRAALEPHLTKTGRNNFEGYKSNRVYALLAKSPEVFSDMVIHPLVLSFAEAELGPSCLLSALLAINLHPGETVQDWHHDDANIHVPLPHPPYGLSAFWAVDDTTEDNGATEIIPGSHLWEERPYKTDYQDLFDNRERDVNQDPQPHPDAVKITMPSGSVMIAKSTLWHRGGANKSDTPRMIVTPQYCAGWARQLENMTLAVPPNIATGLPKRTRELMGYSIHGSFMGYVDGQHPDKLLGATRA